MREQRGQRITAGRGQAAEPSIGPVPRKGRIAKLDTVASISARTYAVAGWAADAARSAVAADATLARDSSGAAVAARITAARHAAGTAHAPLGGQP